MHSIKLRRPKIWVTAIFIAALAVIGSGSAIAIAASSPAATQFSACVPANRTIINVYTNVGSAPACPTNTQHLVITSGAKGDKGDTGPSGVQAIASHDFGSASGIITGGSFVSLSSEIGTYDIAAGTYQACLNGKVEQPTAATGSVSAQLFLYDQPKSSSFAGDLLNTSTTPQGGTAHDSYMSGCTIINELAPATLHLYAFGYVSDSGSGTFNLMDANLQLVKLTPAA